jgi:hypothetical protein
MVHVDPDQALFFAVLITTSGLAWPAILVALVMMWRVCMVLTPLLREARFTSGCAEIRGGRNHGREVMRPPGWSHDGAERFSRFSSLLFPSRRVPSPPVQRHHAVLLHSKVPSSRQHNQRQNIDIVASRAGVHLSGCTRAPNGGLCHSFRCTTSRCISRHKCIPTGCGSPPE